MIDIEVHIQILLQGRSYCSAVGSTTRRQFLAVSYLKVGLSYRELPHPRSCPLQGSLHLVNEQGWGQGMKTQYRTLGREKHSPQSSSPGWHFWAYNVFKLPLPNPASPPSFHGYWSLRNTWNFNSISESVSRDPNHNCIVVREQTLHDFNCFKCIKTGGVAQHFSILVYISCALENTVYFTVVELMF